MMAAETLKDPDQPTTTASSEELGPYEPGEWLDDDLRRVRLWLARHALLHRGRDQHPDTRSRHMFVSNAEVDTTLLDNELGEDDKRRLGAIEAALQAVQRRQATRIEQTLAAGRNVATMDVGARFNLSRAELDILIALAAAEIDNDIARAYTNAWCDFTVKQPNVAFVLELLTTTRRQQRALREAFAPDGTLRKLALILEGRSDRWSPAPPLLYRPIRVSDRLVDFLLTGNPRVLDVALDEVARLEEGSPGDLDELLIPDSIKNYLGRVLGTHARTGEPARVMLFGPEKCGKRSLARAMAAMPGRRLLVLEADKLPETAPELHVLLRIAERDARLADADLYLRLPPGFGDRPPELLEVMQRWLRQCRTTVFLGSATSPTWLRKVDHTVEVGVPFPTVEVQKALWRRALATKASLEAGFTLDELVASYALSGGAIERAASEAIHIARVATGGARQLVLPRGLLQAKAAEQLTHRLGILAEKVTRMMSWDDLVLPEDTLSQLGEFVDQYRNQHKVYDEWGFSAKVAYGRGLSALFHGPPGTGKTMVAGVLARELGLELYVVDLSRVVDKYVGETEKNLGRIFDEASRSRAILLFDEADSLFSKRTEVKSSHDRYANLETNYLLQRIESFDGVCLLTTNFEASIDNAFKRRLRFRIAFPFPETEHREILWRSMIPAQAQISRRVDFAGLAEKFEMTGGHIKNAVLRAAFDAARSGSRITNEILWTAASNEYREMGKLIRAGDDEEEF